MSWKSLRGAVPALGLALLAPAASAARAPDWLEASRAEVEASRDNRFAVAMLLDEQTVTFLPEGRSRWTFRGALRATTEAALGRVGIPLGYNPNTDRIVSCRAWSLSADGRKVKEYGIRDFVDTAAQISSYFWDARRVLQVDGSDKVEVGGVFGWEIEAEFDHGVDDSSRIFLPDVRTLRASFEAVPAPGSELQWYAEDASLRQPAPGSAPGALRWSLRRTLPVNGLVPAGFIPDPLEVSVRCVKAGSPPAAWPDIGRLAAGIMEARTDATGPVAAQARASMQGKASRWNRVRALTDFVQRQITYLEITLDKDNLAGYRPHPAAAVLQNRYGDCKDKANLLVSMLRAAGEDARFVLLTAGNPRAVRADWPSAEFNHAIVAIPAGSDAPASWPVVDAGPLGRFVIFDPTDPSTPLGRLSPPDQGGAALIVSQEGGALVKLPLDEDAGDCRRAISARLDSFGGVEAEVEETLASGQAAALHGMRHALGRDRFTRALEARLHRASPLAEAVSWQDSWDPEACRYRLDFRFRAARRARLLSDGLMLVSPELVPGYEVLPEWGTRTAGVVLLPADGIDEEVRLKLPPGFAVDALPGAWSRPEGPLTAEMSYRAQGGDLVYRFRFQRRAGFYDQAEYEALRTAYEALGAAQRRPILIRRAAPENHS